MNDKDEKFPFEQRAQRDRAWSLLNSQVVGAETVFAPDAAADTLAQAESKWSDRVQRAESFACDAGSKLKAARSEVEKLQAACDELVAAIAALRLDKERLEHLINSGDRIAFRQNNISTGWVCNDALGRWTASAFKTPREAIDAAMNKKESN